MTEHEMISPFPLHHLPLLGFIQAASQQDGLMIVYKGGDVFFPAQPRIFSCEMRFGTQNPMVIGIKKCFHQDYCGNSVNPMGHTCIYIYIFKLIFTVYIYIYMYKYITSIYIYICLYIYIYLDRYRYID